MSLRYAVDWFSPLSGRTQASPPPQNGVAPHTASLMKVGNLKGPEVPHLSVSLRQEAQGALEAALCSTRWGAEGAGGLELCEFAEGSGKCGVLLGSAFFAFFFFLG